MSEIEQLQSRLADLERQVRALERSRRASAVRARWAAAAITAVALVLGFTGRGDTAGSPKTITCGALTIVGPDGLPKIQMAGTDTGGKFAIANDHSKPGITLADGVMSILNVDGTTAISLGNGALTVNGPDGKPRSSVGQTPDGAGQVSTVGADGAIRTEMGSDKDGGAVRVCANDGKPRVVLACQGNGAQVGVVNLRSADGGNRLYLGANLLGGEMQTYSPDGKILTDLHPTTSGGSFALNGIDEKPHVAMGSSVENIGFIDTRGNDGIRRVIIGYDKLGGTVIVNGPDDRVRTGLYVGDDGSGRASFFDRSNRLIKSLP